MTLRLRAASPWKPGHAAAGLLVAAAVFMSPGLAAAQKAAPSWTAGQKVAATFFFYWYDVYSGLHIFDRDGSDALTDHPPDAAWPYFSYTSLPWLRQELLDMREARIDAVLPVFWGSDVESYWSIAGLQNIVLAAESLLAERFDPPKIGMFFDTSALLQQNGGQPPDLTTDQGKSLFYDMISKFFALVPEPLWAQVDGRPLIYLYGSYFAKDYDQSLIEAVRSRFELEYGHTPYIVRESSWRGLTTDAEYSWGTALLGPQVIRQAASLGPGYDDSAVLGRSPHFRNRECGDFYAAGWEALADSASTLVSVETWNEYHEGTDVAASREYGRRYIELTAAGIGRWKWSRFPARDLAWTDLGRRPYLQGLHPVGDFPDGAWRVVRLADREAAFPDPATFPRSRYIYLNVMDDIHHASVSEAWVTVEYFDSGTDEWRLEYDGQHHPYTSTVPVRLEDSGQWKTATYYLSDAYFGGRENADADLRLSDMSWKDGRTNYFGRVWVSLSPLAHQAPELRLPDDVTMAPGELLTFPVNAWDPDGRPVELKLDDECPFAGLVDNGNGTGLLTLAPTWRDGRPCPYKIRVVAADTGEPALQDAATILVRVEEGVPFSAAGSRTRGQ